MAIVINGSGTVTGLSVGGLPDGTVDAGTLASSAVTEAKIATDAVTAAKIPASLENTFVSGRKNMIINGAMNVAQRGTSFSQPNGNTLDRFRNYVGTGGALTVTQESFATGQTDVPDAKYFMRMNQTTARTSGAWLLQYKIEDVQSVPAGNIVLSFYAKANASKELKFRPYQLFGSGGSSTVSLTTHTFTLGTSWQKFTFTISNSSISGNTIGTSSNFMIEIRDESQGTYTFDLAQVQLEKGSTATDFEHRSYGEELALCERYYWRLDRTTGGGNTIVTGSNYSHSIAVIFYPRVMRTSPTIAKVGTNYALYSDTTNHGAKSLAGTSSGTRQNRLLFSLAGTRGHAFHLDLDNDDTYFTYDAEL